MARLRSAVAKSASRRDGERVEPHDDVQERPTTGAAHEHKDDSPEMSTDIQSELESDEHFDRLAELRLMARRLADQSKAGGDLRRSRANGNGGHEASELLADDVFTPRPARPHVSRTATRHARTVELVHATDDVDETDGALASAATPTVEPGASIRDRLSHDAPPSGYDHDAAEVLQPGENKRRPWLVIAASAGLILGGLATGASMMLRPGQAVTEPSRRAELAAEPPVALADIAKREQPKAEPMAAAEPARPEPPAASPERDRDVAVTPTEPAVEPAPSRPPQVMSQPTKIVATPPAPTRTIRLTPAELHQVQNLMASGRTRVAAGDVAGARAIYQRAADLGDGPAALALAETYDPAVLARPGVTGIKADLSTARHWYQTAADRGVVEARARLERLPSR
jgi:hypothetical protein